MATPPPTKAQVLADVLELATSFSACVEGFNLIHPSKDSDHAQKVALAKLGIQQGRLLILGDAVGISSPPATIAKCMIPSNPGLTNPDPTLPVNFGVRDPRLDEPSINKKVCAALTEIAGRPVTVSREQLMERYGLKSPKRFGTIEYPALDTNRLAAFREKYALLQDLVRQSGVRPASKRSMSITTQHWTVHNVARFDEYVKTVRTEVDALIALMEVREKVDRGMRTDIKAMGWHPDLYVPIVRSDYEKLALIREATFIDYPEYIEATETAMKYISEELKGAGAYYPRAASLPQLPTRRDSFHEKSSDESKTGANEHEKRPSLLSRFKFKSWAKSSSRVPQTPSKSAPSSPNRASPAHRAMSEDLSINHARGAQDPLQPQRSKSLSDINDPMPSDLDSRLESVPTHHDEVDQVGIPIQNASDDKHLTHADTVHSLIERHDMFKGIGRVESKDIRAKAHDWAK